MTQQKISRDKAIVTDFGANMEPVLRINAGETFLVETQDNFFGKIADEGLPATPEALPFLNDMPIRVNPVAGPIYVEGIEAGDLLVVEIEDIIPSERGWTGFMPGLGNLAGNVEFPDLQGPYTVITYHKPGPSGTTSDGTGTFNVVREVTYPLKPFIGTIMTAPKRGVDNTLTTQGPWGGNLDCQDVRKGNKIMFNTFHDGGLLFIGDVHAAQGDSEYTGLADETAADVFASCQIIKNKVIPSVMRIETPTSIIQVDSAANHGNMENALNGAFIGLLKWLAEDYGMDRKEAYLHFTANPEVIIHTYQACLPSFYVVGVEFPKKYL